MVHEALTPDDVRQLLPHAVQFGLQSSHFGHIKLDEKVYSEAADCVASIGVELCKEICPVEVTT